MIIPAIRDLWQTNLHLEKEDIEMTELKENVVENTQRQALTKALNRIRKRGRPHFTNPLKVVHYESDEMWCISGDCQHPVFHIVEVHETKACWIGIIPSKQYRTLFTIYSGFYGDHNKKEINCSVFDRSLLDIVKEEIQKYADAFQATAVNLIQDFAR